MLTDVSAMVALSAAIWRRGRERWGLLLLITSFPTVVCPAADRTPAGHMIVGHAPARQDDSTL